MYRHRSKAEGHIREMLRVANPACRPRPRRNATTRGRSIARPEPGVDAFACDGAPLFLIVFGRQIMGAQGAVLAAGPALVGS